MTGTKASILHLPRDNMARREIGLFGYVGEAVVAQWLDLKYGTDNTEIVGQVRPLGISPRGGPYLDFAVVQFGTVIALYEIKTQDYIWDMRVNAGLAYIWQHRGKSLEFKSQVGQRLMGTSCTVAKLVLLVPPNDKGVAHIGQANLPDVILFEEILANLGGQLDIQRIIDWIAEDLTKVIAILKQPTAGRRMQR